MPLKPHPTDSDKMIFVREEYAFPQATTDELYFRDPAIHPPPRATSMLLLNPGGVCIIGVWDDSCIGWCPKPKIPKELKGRR